MDRKHRSANPSPGLTTGRRKQQLDQRDRDCGDPQSGRRRPRRKLEVRRKLLESMGGLPTYSGPLNARITGQIRTEFRTVEKAIFESLRGFYVTGNLYRPNARGRYPAVLVPAGHTQEGKPEAQIRAANLARKGFVVLFL